MADQSVSGVSTIAELESRLRDLELRFLGPPTETSCPFNPTSGHRSSVEKFKESCVSSGTVRTATFKDAKLPKFNGQDLDRFLKDWERWLRLSGLLETTNRLSRLVN